jgi:hypothetical protein
MSYLVGRTVPHEFILCFSKSSKSLGEEKKLSIHSLCPKPSTLQVKCLTAACVTVMSSVAERVFSFLEAVPSLVMLHHLSQPGPCIVVLRLVLVNLYSLQIHF